jgi:hypothetical protein
LLVESYFNGADRDATHNVRSVGNIPRSTSRTPPVASS